MTDCEFHFFFKKKTGLFFKKTGSWFCWSCCSWPAGPVAGLVCESTSYCVGPPRDSLLVAVAAAATAGRCRGFAVRNQSNVMTAFRALLLAVVALCLVASVCKLPPIPAPRGAPPVARPPTYPASSQAASDASSTNPSHAAAR